MLESIVSAVGAAYLITAMFALKFQYWNRPKLLVFYFLAFGLIEWIAFEFFIPRDAFGPWLTYLFYALGTAVVIAIILVDRHEKRHERREDPLSFLQSDEDSSP